MTLPGANRHLGRRGIQEGECSAAEFSAARADKRPFARGRHGGPVARFNAGERQRAQRFPIQTALRYRTAGRGEWREGTMLNISKSGVLFSTEHPVWPNTPVDLAFSLPAVRSRELPAQVVCNGLIARAISDPDSARVTALAARITRYRFVRPERA